MKAKLWIFGVLVVSMAFFGGCDGDGDSTTPTTEGEVEEAIDVTGTWEGEIQLPDGPTSASLELTQSGTTVTGANGYTGILTGNRLILHRDQITFDMTVVGDTMTGTYSDSSWNDRPTTLTRQ